MARPESACGRSGTATLLAQRCAAAPHGHVGPGRSGPELSESCPLQPGWCPDARPLLCAPLCVGSVFWAARKEGLCAVSRLLLFLLGWEGRVPLTGQGLCCPTGKSRVAACDRPRRKAESGVEAQALPCRLAGGQCSLKVGGAASPGVRWETCPPARCRSSFRKGQGRWRPPSLRGV